MDLCNPKEIKALLGRHGFHFSKSKGQNFLIQSWVPQQAAEASGAAPGVGVLEIGPGIGPLTAQLAQRGEKVAAVELDATLLPILAETMASYPNVEIVPGDILKLDIPELVDREFPGLTPLVCANLPYNITTPVLTALVEARRFQTITVMIQREVAKRICAQPGTAEYGAFTLLCQYYAHCEVLFDVPPSCFLPAPKVTSSVIRMTVREAPPVPVGDPALFFRVVRGAFAQRRKTLINSLSSSLTDFVGKEEVTQALRACNLTETIRGERLTFADFAQLTEKLQEIRGS